MHQQIRQNSQPTIKSVASNSVQPYIQRIIPLKSDYYSFLDIRYEQKILKSFQRRSSKFQPVDQQCINLTLNEFASGIVSRLKLSLQTHALGLYIYYGIVLKKIGYSSNQLLYVSVSIYLASKVIERDTKIVNLTTLKKAACTYISKEDYVKAEKIILHLLNFNCEIDTFVSLVNVYLWRGIVFSDEKQFQGRQLNIFEHGILIKCSTYIRNGRFLMYKPHKLAAYIIQCARKDLGLQGWRHELQAVSNINLSQILQIVKDVNSIDKPPINVLKQKNSNSCSKQQLVLQKKVHIQQNKTIPVTQAITRLSPNRGQRQPHVRLFGKLSDEPTIKFTMSRSLATHLK